MDATALSKLRRSDIVALAKANKIKANLSTKEITRQLLDRFPNGVLPPTPKTPSTPLSAARNIVGRVKDAFKTISRGSRTASPSPVAQRPSQNTAATTRVQLDDTDYFADPQPPPPAHILPPLPVVDTGNATEKRGSPEALPEPGPSVQPPRLPEGKLSKDQTVPGVVVGPSQPPLPPLAPLPSNHTEEDETEYHNPAELAAADPEDVRLLIRDMAAISANNKIYIEKAAALREQALKLDDEAEDLRTALLREKFRRQRLEDYFKNWRAIDPEWSYPAIWGGDITFAPVLVGFENVNGSVVMDAEVSTSDDEELVSSWHRQDEAFRTRRRTSATQKAAERGVNIEMVSEDDLDTDEEAFYSSFVLRPPEDDGITPDSEYRVYPFMDRTAGILCNWKDEIIVPHGSNVAHIRKHTLDDRVQSEDEARYSPRARIERESGAKGKAKMKPEDEADLDATLADGRAWDRERYIAKALGKTVGDNWEGLGAYVAGWRMRDGEDKFSGGGM